MFPDEMVMSRIKQEYYYQNRIVMILKIDVIIFQWKYFILPEVVAVTAFAGEDNFRINTGLI